MGTEINGIDTRALAETIRHVAATPSLGQFRFRATNDWDDAGRNASRVESFYGAGEERTSDNRPFTVRADEPEVLLSTDEAPNPVELLLCALASCVTTSVAYHAAARGLKLEAIHSELEGSLDLQGFLGLSQARKGYQDIRVHLTARGDATAEQLRELCDFSPVLDVVSHGTRVDVQVTMEEDAPRAPIAEQMEAQL